MVICETLLAVMTITVFATTCVPCLLVILGCAEPKMSGKALKLPIYYLKPSEGNRGTDGDLTKECCDLDDSDRKCTCRDYGIEFDVFHFDKRHGKAPVEIRGKLRPAHQSTGWEMERLIYTSNETLVPNGTLENCVQTYETEAFSPGEIYCNWAWDSVLCWPPTKAGSTATLKCPRDRGFDISKFVHKKCSANGKWEGRTKNDFSSPQGWTNYSTCFTPEMWELYTKLYAVSEDNAKVKLGIAERTRTLEIVGFSVSFVALLISLLIFFRFRSLRNNRTRIHRNLFIAMEIQVVMRLILYTDQIIIRANAGKFQSRHGIDNTPLLCEASYVLLEYARTAMFMWMFVEGLYLHNMITVTVFHHEESYYALYTAIGWGAPVLMTTAWAGVTAWYYTSSKCWWGYNLTVYFWILEGPRLGVILLNFLFLLNVIRVLVVKLRQSRKSEIEQIRKAVRAAILLVPLLGLTNLISMSKTPLDKSVLEFALWSYSTHFLTSFQGFILAFLYCFLNGEVRTAIMKSISTYFSLRSGKGQSNKQTVLCGVYVPEKMNRERGETEEDGNAATRERQSPGGAGAEMQDILRDLRDDDKSGIVGWNRAIV